MEFEKFFTEISKRRKPSPIRALQPLMAIPGMISLGGGLPNPSAFPFDEITMKLKDGTSCSLASDDLSRALQYGPTPGVPLFVKKLTELVKEYHVPQYEGWGVCVTTGGQDGLSRCFEMILDAKSAIIVEDPTYPGALASLGPIGCKIASCNTDDEGLIPSSLSETLESWSDSSKVKAIYLIPTGQNPRGSTSSLKRRKEIYAIAQKHDILILEDDPYFFLKYDFFSPDTDNTSYFSLDTDGRVIRFDSFSKVLSAGLRLGWVTAHQAFLEKINLHMQAGELHASSLSQSVVMKLLDMWGSEGFKDHIRMIQELYLSKRDDFLKMAEKHLKGLVEWDVPKAGMFCWLKLLNIEDSSKLVEKGAKEKLVLMVPGNAFDVDSEKPSPYVRASFSIATSEQIDEALKRFAELLRG